MISDARSAFKNMVQTRSWMSTMWGEDRIEELSTIAEQLFAEVDGPRVTVQIPVAVLSTAVSYVCQAADRMPEGNGYCQWPVSHAGEWGDGTCGRTGYGSYLPVCHQHVDHILAAASDLLENFGGYLKPYQLSRFLAAINAAQPYGLDQLVTQRIDSIRCGSYEFDDRLASGQAFMEAVDQLLVDRMEERWGA